MKQELEYKLWSHILKEPWIQWYDLQKTADSQEIKLGIQLKAEKPVALISEKEYENILKFLQKGK